MPRCPSCFIPLVRVEEQGIKAAVCSNCFGTWIGSIGLLRRMHLDADEARDPSTQGKATTEEEASLTDLAEVVAAADTQGLLRCPQCEKPMTKDRFHPMIPVQIDRCKPCASVWLDAGEFAMLRRLYRELMTSDDPEIQRRREKVARALSNWESGRMHTHDVPEEMGGNVGIAMDAGFDILGYFLRGVL